jgi:hypothetical protein
MFSPAPAPFSYDNVMTHNAVGSPTYTASTPALSPDASSTHSHSSWGFSLASATAVASPARSMSSCVLATPIPSPPLNLTTLGTAADVFEIPLATPGACGCKHTHTWRHSSVRLSANIADREIRPFDCGWYCPVDGGTCGAVIFGGRGPIREHAKRAHGLDLLPRADAACPIAGCGQRGLKGGSLLNHAMDKHGGEGWGQAVECTHCLQIFNRPTTLRDGARHPLAKCQAQREALVASIQAYKEGATTKICLPAAPKIRTHTMRRERALRTMESGPRTSTTAVSHAPNGPEAAVDPQLHLPGCAVNNASTLVARTQHHTSRFNPMSSRQLSARIPADNFTWWL